MGSAGKMGNNCAEVDRIWAVSWRKWMMDESGSRVSGLCSAR
jgi:hypothetical protein